MPKCKECGCTFEYCDMCHGKLHTGEGYTIDLLTDDYQIGDYYGTPIIRLSICTNCKEIIREVVHLEQAKHGLNESGRYIRGADIYHCPTSCEYLAIDPLMEKSIHCTALYDNNCPRQDY